MKTIHEYEPSDIDIKDPLHGFLMGQIFIVGLTGFKPQDGDPTDDPMFAIRRMIANFLNGAAKAGISIAQAETVPDVYR